MFAETVPLGNEQSRDFLLEQSSPFVIPVAEMAEDEFTRHQAERLIRYAGELVLGSRPEMEEQTGNKAMNLMEAVHLAVSGDAVALKFVEANVATDTLERTIKSGLILEVDLEVDEDYEVSQHGQNSDIIQANTLVYASSSPKMRERTEAEARNSQRIKNLNKSGVLEDYYFVVFSRTADNMSNDELDEAHFFKDSMPVAIQATTSSGMGLRGLKTESGFVAGIVSRGEERHDQQTLEVLGDQLEVDLREKTAAELIDYPLLIHKSLMPNGVIDLAKLYDECAGGLFFGEAKHQVDYIEYREQCRERAEGYLPKIQHIMGKLLAAADQIDSPIAAIKMLDKLSDSAMVQLAAEDTRINPMVFGPDAAVYIEQARLHMEAGNEEMAKAATSRAQGVSRSFSCPSLMATKRSEAEASSSESSDGNAAETWHGGKKHYNSKCNSCKKIKSEVGACHICKDCVLHPAKMKKAWDERKQQVIAKANIPTPSKTEAVAA